MQLLIRRSGNLIDVSPDGVSPLPLDCLNLLTPLMRYEHKTLLRGHAAYDAASGQRSSISVELRNLYAMEQGRLTTGVGYINTINAVLQRHGHAVHYLDLSPPRPRPDCYVPDWNNLLPHVTFRPRQQECLQAIVDHEFGLIDACTGFGKTELFKMIALLFPRARIHIVVRPKDVAARIVRQLSKVLPNVGMVGGGKARTGRVTVYTADSLHRSDGDCDILLCDEAHQLVAETYVRELGRAYRFSRNFAFTATPEGRMDGACARLKMFFGDCIFRLTYQEGVALGLVVPIHVRWLPIRLQHNPAAGKTGTSRDRWGIWRNTERNAIIANDARTTYPADTQVLMLCATVDHAIHLWQHLPEFTLCYSGLDEEDFERYQKNHYIPFSFQRMTTQRRDAMRNDFEEGVLKKVIATDVWATGVDFARLQVCYRVDCRESEILDTQAGGRPSRIFTGEDGVVKEYGEVVDCVDLFDKTLKRKAETRKRHYRKLGWSQDWPSGRRQISYE